LIELKIPQENLFSVSIRIFSQGQFAIGYHHAGDIVDEVLADILNRRIAPIGVEVVDDRFHKLRSFFPRSLTQYVFFISEMLTVRQKKK